MQEERAEEEAGEREKAEKHDAGGMLTPPAHSAAWSS